MTLPHLSDAPHLTTAGQIDGRASTDTSPVLLVVHGTGDPQGQQTFSDLRDAVAARIPHRQTHLAFVDVQTPTVADTVSELAGEPFTVVPAFLGAGYHVNVDIPQVLAARAQDPRVTDSLGPEPELIDALAERWQATAAEVDHLVLGTTGSSDPRSREQTRQIASMLSERLTLPVTAAFCASGSPTVPEAIEQLTTTGARLGIVSNLLAPGHFHRKLRRAAPTGVSVSEPIGTHPRLIDLIIRRLG